MNARARRCLKIAAFAVVEAILVGGSGLPARAQFPDVLSEVECRGCAARLAAALPLEGTWSTPLTSAGDAGWALADFAALNARPLRFGCDALVFEEQVVSPLPLTIRREGGALVLRYEERGAVRTIALDGPAPAPVDARLGTSTGRFERDTLVVETRAGLVNATERYSVSADGRWLTLSLE